MKSIKKYETIINEALRSALWKRGAKDCRIP